MLMTPDGDPEIISAEPAGIVARTFNAVAHPGFILPMLSAMFVTMPLGIAVAEIFLGGHSLHHDEASVAIGLLAAAKIGRKLQRDLHLG